LNFGIAANACWIISGLDLGEPLYAGGMDFGYALPGIVSAVQLDTYASDNSITNALNILSWAALIEWDESTGTGRIFYRESEIVLTPRGRPQSTQSAEETRRRKHRPSAARLAAQSNQGRLMR
jgi:hypothetical protein